MPLKSIRRYYRLNTPIACVFVIKFAGSAAIHMAIRSAVRILDAFSLSDCSQCVHWNSDSTVYNSHFNRYPDCFEDTAFHTVSMHTNAVYCWCKQWIRFELIASALTIMLLLGDIEISKLVWYNRKCISCLCSCNRLTWQRNWCVVLCLLNSILTTS